jgi:hypothetical protein
MRIYQNSYKVLDWIVQVNDGIVLELKICMTDIDWRIICIK